MVKSQQLCSLFVHFLIIAHDMPLSKNKPTGHLQEEAARLMRATSSRSVSVSVSSSYRSYSRGTTVSLFIYVISLHPILVHLVTVYFCFFTPIYLEEFRVILIIVLSLLFFPNELSSNQ